MAGVAIRGGNTNGLTAWKGRKSNLIKEIEYDFVGISAQWPFCRLNSE